MRLGMLIIGHLITLGNCQTVSSNFDTYALYSVFPRDYVAVNALRELYLDPKNFEFVNEPREVSELVDVTIHLDMMSRFEDFLKVLNADYLLVESYPEIVTEEIDISSDNSTEMLNETNSTYFA